MRASSSRSVLPLVLSVLLLTIDPAPATQGREQGGAGPAGPTVRTLWTEFQKTMPAFSFERVKDEVVRSDTDPRQTLRRIEVKFYSQEIGGKKWGHQAVIFMPTDRRLLQSAKRRGKVVVVGQRSIDSLITGSWRDSFLGNYGEPIAARTGYPTMIVPVPGEYDDTPGREIPIGFLDQLSAKTKNPVDYADFRLAIPYLRALDVFAAVLGEPHIQAIIGGHSKRATSAITAATMDPERIVSVIYMGNETTFSRYEQGPLRVLSPYYTEKRATVLYLGATNEDGYEMFNINRIQARMSPPWTIEYIPNYRHADQSERHFLDWQMWVAHVFDGRPLTTISDLAYEETDEGTLFRARLESPNKILLANVWSVYCDDVPYWRDLMWYPEAMMPKGGGVYEAYVPGSLPDAWLVEVKDIADGFAGYVSSLPQDITHKLTKTRISRGSHSRNWEPKKPPAAWR